LFHFKKKIWLCPIDIVHPEVELDPANQIEPEDPQPQVPPRRLSRERISAIANDYIVYLQENKFDIGLKDDPTSLNEV